MARIPLLGGAYRSRSPIASGQETINLIPEKNTDPQAPAPYTFYLTPGTILFGTPAEQDNCRCLYRTSIGTAYAVIGVNVYFIAINGAMVFIGAIPDRESQVIMSDNGLVAVLVDGVDGFVIDLATNAFGQIVDAAFYGADFVVFLDTFFVFNRPDTNQFYISLSMVDFAMLTGGAAFDPLDIAAKSGSADKIVGIATVHKELWLIGELTTEIWIGTGAPDFYFQLIQGMYIDHGCLAPFSIASQDVLVFWLMKDRQGQFQIMMGTAGQVKNIGTSYLNDLMHGIISQGLSVSDAIGGVFAQEDHAYYSLAFVSANIQFLYDLTSNEWVKWSWLDENGNINRHRANCFMFFNDRNIIGDWENGKLYILDPLIYNDFGGPILRRKTFMHMVGNRFERVNYLNFDADIEVATTDVDFEDENNIPQISLSWSDNRGRTYGNPVQQSMGAQGQFQTVVSWNRLGQARDRIFKLEWSADVKTSLLGGFADIRVAKS
jgi:hypothetical protein